MQVQWLPDPNHDQAPPDALRVLFITSQWPRSDKPGSPFVTREVEGLRTVGVVVDVLDYPGGFHPGNYWRGVRAMRHALNSRRYDLVHAYFGQCGLVARAQRRLPVVVTYAGSDVHGIPAARGLGRIRHYVLLVVGRVLSLLVDEVIVVSRHLGEALPRRDFHVIPGSINLTLFQPIDQAEARARLGLHPTRRLALFAALNPANPRKRFGLAQAAMAIIQKHMDAELVVATGVSSEMMPVYMSACDALLLTSAHEGSTNVLKEALACNLPVVSTRVGDSHERLDGLPGCAVCDEAEPEVIAAALLRTFQMESRPDLRASVLDLDDRLLAGKIVQVYRQALARRPPAQRAVLHEERP